MLHNATILITGGAGFIGTSLVRRLVEHNRIRVFDNLRRNALAETGLDRHPNVELVVDDVCDAKALREATKGMQYVVHMASIAGVDTVLKHPVRTMEVALEGTMNALRAAVPVALGQRKTGSIVATEGAFAASQHGRLKLSRL